MLATFLDKAAFEDAIFRGKTSFMLTDFQKIATFLNATFEDEVTFEGAEFGQIAGFDAAHFLKMASMNAHYSGTAHFNEATFHNTAVFTPASFDNRVEFMGATFNREAWFNDSVCNDSMVFSTARFNDETDFKGLRTFGDVRFDGALFDRARRLGPMAVGGKIVLDEASFRERIMIVASSPSISCERTRFSEGLNLRARWAELSFDHSDFAGSSILTHNLNPVPLKESTFGLEGNESSFLPYWESGGGPPRNDRSQPWISSLCGANLTGVSIASLDLRACIIADAHNLDKLRLEGPRAFSRTPRWKAVRTGWAFPPFWKWTKRQTLAEEHIWRHDYENGLRREGWHWTSTWPSVESNWVIPLTHTSVLRIVARCRRRPSGRLTYISRVLARHRKTRKATTERRRRRAREIAALYRALRKGHEDNKDEPGAADFYYGEMEMRRAALPLGVERTVLHLYWLVSGYALRASRSLTAALVFLFSAAVLLRWVGFAEVESSGTGLADAPTASTSLSATLIYCAKTGIGLMRDPQPTLTLWGDVIQILVRLLIPVFLGLTVLSVRGRVKR